jgi:histone H3/H4
MRRKNISFDVLNRALTKPGFLRIIREFDIQNVNHLVYEELRGELKVKLEELIYKLDILLKYRKKKTISINDVMFLIDDPKLFLKYFDLEKCKKDESVECLYFQKTPFTELIQLVLQYMNCNYYLKKGVPILIQYYIETFLKNILKKSKLIIYSRRKKTLLPRDIRLILDM